MAQAPRPQINISSLHFEWDTLDEAFSRCRDDLGLDGIEFSMRAAPAKGHVAPEQCAEAAACAQSFGMATRAHIWDNLAQLGPVHGPAVLRAHLDAMRRLGAEYMVVHGGTHDDQAEGIRLTAEVLGEVAPDYQRAGVVLCIENHYAYDYQDAHELFSTPEEFLALFDAVRSPAVRFCLDYGHSHMTGNTDDMLQRLGPYLAYTHIADNMGEDDDHLAFGRGSVDWGHVLESTRRAGYCGPFTVEFPVLRGDAGPLHDCLQTIAEVYDA